MIVVGAGIVGACVAYQLARDGAAVTLLDREPAPVAGVTGNSFAWIGDGIDGHWPGGAADLRPHILADHRRLAAEVPAIPIRWCGSLSWPPSSQPTSRPDERPDEPPDERPDERPDEPPNERPDERLAARPDLRQAEQRLAKQPNQSLAEQLDSDRPSSATSGKATRIRAAPGSARERSPPSNRTCAPFPTGPRTPPPTARWTPPGCPPPWSRPPNAAELAYSWERPRPRRPLAA